MHWPMVSPSKMVEILEAKKVDPEAEAKKLAIAIEKAETALKKAQRKETAANTLENATAKASSTDLGNIKKQKAHKKAEADLKRANANTKKAQAALDKLKA